MFPTDYNFTNSIQSTKTATNAQHKVGGHLNSTIRHIVLYLRMVAM